jgi:drug/metabolite transporter (DMT)-like permease
VNTALLLLAITGLTLIGDFFIKSASERPEGLISPAFFIGLCLYALPAVGWFFLMRAHSLAAIGVLYSASTIVLLAVLGYFVFKEPFGAREIIGLLLAIASVVVMSYEA